MAKKKKDNKSEEFELLSTKQLQELQTLMMDMLSLAKEVKEEYSEEITESDMSSSIDEIVRITEESPFLDETFKGNEWRDVLKSLAKPNKPRDKEDDSK